MTMKHATLLALAATATLGLVLGLVAAGAVPVVYKTPPETAEFKPGPNLELVKNDCSGCHSADYVGTQPPAKSRKDFWQAEVTKMIKVYGAPIDEADVPRIVEYLAATY
jgi:mono/diheme cytochrome c family protein